MKCTRSQAEAIPFGDAFADDDDPPTLLTDEPDPARPDDWLLDAYFTAEPAAADLARLARLVPGIPAIESLADADWVTLSQAGFPPVRAGRFFVHTAAHAAERRPGEVGIAIEAGLAFGTGQHFTTRGCLEALADIARIQKVSDGLDLGTGSGVLALAMARTWRKARIVASDIDPVAVAVARANVAANGVRRGRIAGTVDLVTATGMAHPRLSRRYDLITANILANPLIAMARPVAAALAPGGILVLAGLLTTQARAVTAAYTARGCILIARYDRGEWPTLVMRATRGTAPPRAAAATD